MGFFSKKTNDKDLKKTDNLIDDQARYKSNPMNILFENFILDTIQHLPQEKVDLLNKMNLAKVFNTEEMDWKLIIKKVLNLSDTIEIAIMDLWYRNSEIAQNQNVDYHPVQFARDFVDNFYKEDSKVDVWDADSLEQAKQRISNYGKKLE